MSDYENVWMLPDNSFAATRKNGDGSTECGIVNFGSPYDFEALPVGTKRETADGHTIGIRKTDSRTEWALLAD